MIPRNVTSMGMPHHVEGRRPTVFTGKCNRKVVELLSLGQSRMVILLPRKTVENFLS